MTEIPQRTTDMDNREREALEAALTVAVADVLHRFGLHPHDSPEDAGWTLEMVGDFGSLMVRQVDQMLTAKGLKGAS